MGIKTSLFLSNTGRAVGAMGALYGCGKWAEHLVLGLYHKMSIDFEDKAYSIINEFSKQGNTLLDRAQDINNNVNSSLDGMLNNPNIPLESSSCKTQNKVCFRMIIQSIYNFINIRIKFMCKVLRRNTAF